MLSASLKYSTNIQMIISFFLYKWLFHSQTQYDSSSEISIFAYRRRDESYASFSLTAPPQVDWKVYFRIRATLTFELAASISGNMKSMHNVRRHTDRLDAFILLRRFLGAEKLPDDRHVSLVSLWFMCAANMHFVHRNIQPLATINQTFFFKHTHTQLNSLCVRRCCRPFSTRWLLSAEFKYKHNVHQSLATFTYLCLITEYVFAWMLHSRM